MIRLPYPNEIAEAAEYVFGCSVEHTGTRTLGYKYLAKATYWQALAWFGFNSYEIAGMVGADRATVSNGLHKDVRDDILAAVIERARAIVYNDTCVEDVSRMRTDVPAQPGFGPAVWPMQPPASDIRPQTNRPLDAMGGR